jgi:hypothetical protein
MMAHLRINSSTAAAALWGAVCDVWTASRLVRTPKYRPEKHYMRGPGPKWFAKHCQVSSVAEPH